MWLILIIFIPKNGEKNHKKFVYFLIFLKKKFAKIRKFTKRKKNWSKNPLEFLFVFERGGGGGNGG